MLNAKDARAIRDSSKFAKTDAELKEIESSIRFAASYGRSEIGSITEIHIENIKHLESHGFVVRRITTNGNKESGPYVISW